MIKISLNIIILVLISCLSACSGDKTLSKSDYLEYFNSPSGKFFKQKNFNKVVYKLKMQTPEYLLLKNNDSIQSLTQFDAELNKRRHTLNFVMLIEDEADSKQVKEVVYKPELYTKLTNYANMQMTDEIKLVHGKDTLPCSLLYLEPANSMQPAIRLAFGFDNLKRSDGDYTVIFNDNLFNNGIIKFKYPNETFADLPKLRF